MLTAGQIVPTRQDHANWEVGSGLVDGQYTIVFANVTNDMLFEAIIDGDNNNKSSYWALEYEGNVFPLKQLIKMGFPATINRRTHVVDLTTPTVPQITFDVRTERRMFRGTEGNQRIYTKIA
jgi:hypothetical protein